MKERLLGLICFIERKSDIFLVLLVILLILVAIGLYYFSPIENNGQEQVKYIWYDFKW